MFKHLLIPLDGTPMAEAVLPLAKCLARNSGARVTLLHVMEKNAPEAVHGQPHLHEASQAEGYLEKIAFGFPEEVHVDWHVHRREVEDVAHSVVDHADELFPDLIVMCCHGIQRFRDWFSGNLAQQVLKLGETPVLLYRAAKGATSCEPCFRRVVVPLDGEPDHEVSLGPAADVAVLCSSPVELVEVVATASTVSGFDAPLRTRQPGVLRRVLELAESQAHDYLKARARSLEERGLHVTISVLRGDRIKRLGEVCLNPPADLIVLGSHGKVGADAFWSGSVTQSLLHRCPSSFLFVPAGKSTERQG